VTIVLGIAISLLTSMLILAQPIYMIQIMMNVLPSRNLSTLLAISIVVLLAFVTSAALDYFRAKIVEAAVLRVEATVNHRIVRDYLIGNSEAAMNIAALRDVTLLRNVAMSRLSTSLFELVFVPFILAVVFFVSIPLGIAFLAGILVYLSFVVAQELATRRSRPVLSGIVGEVNYLADGEINRGRMAPGTILHGAFARRYLDANRRYIKALVPSRNLEEMLAGVKMVLRLVLQSLVLGVGAYLAVMGEIEIGVVIGISIISSRALAPLDGVVGGWSTLVEARAAVRRLDETLRARKEVKTKLPLPRPEGHLSVKGVWYEPAEAGRAILRDVGFDVGAGEAVAIIGTTTSGKSTLLKLLASAMAPTRGTIRIDGNELRNWSRSELEHYTGYMPQDGQLLDGTVADTIARFDPEMSPEAVVQAAQDAGIHHIVLTYPQGYNTRIGPNGMPLAAGHRQFIALARALYRRPPVVFLDEPNACLDAEGDKRLAEVLAGLKERKVTVVVVTQRPGLLSHVDRVLILNRGAVQLYGTPEEVGSGQPRHIRPV
jgi:PrtD family type I secretion system ABC transporter